MYKYWEIEECWRQRFSKKLFNPTDFRGEKKNVYEKKVHFRFFLKGKQLWLKKKNHNNTSKESTRKIMKTDALLSRKKNENNEIGLNS